MFQPAFNVLLDGWNGLDVLKFFCCSFHQVMARRSVSLTILKWPLVSFQTSLIDLLDGVVASRCLFSNGCHKKKKKTKIDGETDTEVLGTCLQIVFLIG